MSAERVAAAAVKVRGRVFTAGTHKEAAHAAALALEILPIMAAAEIGPAEQGFTTTRGRWLSRAEAWKLAKKRGQLRWDRSRPGITPELHSEDLR